MEFILYLLCSVTSTLLLYLLVSPVVIWLWNLVCTRIFNLRKLSYWESFGFLVLLGLLYRVVSFTPKAFQIFFQ